MYDRLLLSDYGAAEVNIVEHIPKIIVKLGAGDIFSLGGQRHTVISPV